jgi:hypothetical protein
MASSRHTGLDFSKTAQTFNHKSNLRKTFKTTAQIFKGKPGYVETDGEEEGGSHVGGEHCHVAAWRAAPQVLVWGTHRLYRKYIFMVTLKGRGLEMVFVSLSGILKEY